MHQSIPTNYNCYLGGAKVYYTNIIFMYHTTASVILTAVNVARMVCATVDQTNCVAVWAPRYDSNSPDLAFIGFHCLGILLGSFGHSFCLNKP